MWACLNKTTVIPTCMAAAAVTRSSLLYRHLHPDHKTVSKQFKNYSLDCRQPLTNGFGYLYVDHVFSGDGSLFQWEIYVIMIFLSSHWCSFGKKSTTHELNSGSLQGFQICTQKIVLYRDSDFFISSDLLNSFHYLLLLLEKFKKKFTIIQMNCLFLRSLIFVIFIDTLASSGIRTEASSRNVSDLKENLQTCVYITENSWHKTLFLQILFLTDNLSDRLSSAIITVL